MHQGTNPTTTKKETKRKNRGKIAVTNQPKKITQSRGDLVDTDTKDKVKVMYEHKTQNAKRKKLTQNVHKCKLKKKYYDNKTQLRTEQNAAKKRDRLQKLRAF